jgi:hypothetical protein
MKIVSLIYHVVVPLPGQPGNALLHGGRDNMGSNNHKLLKITRYGNRIDYIRTMGLSPRGRMGPHTVLVGDWLYCFEGDSDLEGPFALSTKTWTVPQIKSPEKAPPLTASAIVAADGKIYLHGGRTANGAVQSKVSVITPNPPKEEVTKGAPKTGVQNGSEVWNGLESPRALPDEAWV